MGCVASKNKDPYVVIVDKYGQEEVKQFIVAMSKVQFIEGNQQAFLAALQQKIDEIKNSVLSQIEQVKMDIDKKYERSLTRIQQANPKAMAAAQKTFKVRIDEVMGYKQVMGKYADYKEQLKLGLQRQQSHTMSYLTNFLKQYDQEERESIPELKKFDALDDDDQETILKTGKKKYKTAVKKGLDQVQKTIMDKCNFENFEPKFKAVLSEQKAAELLKYADRVFVAGEQKVKGASDCKTC